MNIGLICNDDIILAQLCILIRDAPIRIFATDTKYRFFVMWSADTNADSDASSLCNWYVSSLITINFFSDKVIL